MGKSCDADSRKTFGLRRIAPRACVFDSKQHLQTFLSEALEELGFIVCRCGSLEALDRGLGSHYPDLVIFGMSTGGVEASRALEMTARHGYRGKLLLLGPDHSPMLNGVHAFGKGLGLAILPILRTPFADRDLRKAVSSLLPAGPPTPPSIDAAEALDSGWLELWYQPKVQCGSLVIDGAEALIRVRHPTWGVVPPARFVPAAGDPNFQALSEFLIARVLDDWRYFVTTRGRVQVAIKLPLSFFRDQGAAHLLCQMLPKHPAFDGLIVEIDASEVARNLSFSTDLARVLRFHNIGISIDHLGEECPELVEAKDFPFAEIKLDPTFVAGCADDQLRRLACRQIVEFARDVGARSVAGGVENRHDFLALRALGVDLVQGFPFATPMTARKFARCGPRAAF